ncbi:MAG: slipin family protein [Ignavibacteriaceae bacterium]|jgi:regulator of protease activity HflC (stomatin/prohibitin superfamily)
MEFISTFAVVVIIFVIMILSSSIRILKEYERAVVFRIGRLIGAKGPGLVILIPIIDKMVRVSLRTIVMDVPPQDIITKDNVSLKVNAVVYFRVVQASKVVVEVEDFYSATSQISQTTLRSIIGQSTLDELLSEREKINKELQQIIDEQTEPWGVKVTVVEVKQVDLPVEMQRAIAIQAQAERERRAKIINAEGEFQASKKLSEAADVIGKFPVAIQLRFLQTLTEISSDKNSTIIFPLPVDLLKPFMEKFGADKEKNN